MNDLNAIKARLNSLSPTAISKLPKAVQTLIKEDLPRLVEVAEKHSELAPPTTEQQIKEMPF